MEKICSLLINLPWKLHIIYILIPWQHFCHADKHRGKEAGGNDLPVDQEGKEAGLSVPSIVFPFQVD